MNIYQEYCVKNKEKHMIVNACAGSGKSRIIVEKLKQFIENKNVPLESVVTLTHTNSAADNPKQRIGGSRCVEIHTFHGFASRICSLKSTPGIRSVDVNLAQAVLDRVMKINGYNAKTVSALYKEVAECIMNNSAHEDLIVDSLKVMYLEAMSYRKLACFAMVMRKAVNIVLSTSADLPGIEAIQHILLDEYQDTFLGYDITCAGAVILISVVYYILSIQ